MTWQITMRNIFGFNFTLHFYIRISNFKFIGNLLAIYLCYCCVQTRISLSPFLSLPSCLSSYFWIPCIYLYLVLFQHSQCACMYRIVRCQMALISTIWCFYCLNFGKLQESTTFDVSVSVYIYLYLYLYLYIVFTPVNSCVRACTSIMCKLHVNVCVYVYIHNSKYIERSPWKSTISIYIISNMYIYIFVTYICNTSI